MELVSLYNRGHEILVFQFPLDSLFLVTWGVYPHDLQGGKTNKRG